MIINLKNCAERAEKKWVEIELTERFPRHLVAPCLVKCQFEVQSEDNFFVLTLESTAALVIICQRCLKQFPYAYHNKTTLALCNSEEIAENLMIDYEAVVCDDARLDLKEVLTDELHLYTPVYHPDFLDCDKEISAYITQI